jgi:hypothetical protein
MLGGFVFHVTFVVPTVISTGLPVFKGVFHGFVLRRFEFETVLL